MEVLETMCDESSKSAVLDEGEIDNCGVVPTANCVFCHEHFLIVQEPLKDSASTVDISARLLSNLRFADDRYLIVGTERELMAQQL